jgi:hypothetical protein
MYLCATQDKKTSSFVKTLNSRTSDRKQDDDDEIAVHAMLVSVIYIAFTLFFLDSTGYWRVM